MNCGSFAVTFLMPMANSSGRIVDDTVDHQERIAVRQRLAGFSQYQPYSSLVGTSFMRSQPSVPALLFPAL